MMSYFTVLFTASFKICLKLAFIGRLGEQLHSRAEGRFPFCLAGVRVVCENLCRRKEKHRI